jgi:hypothetical protein
MWSGYVNSYVKDSGGHYVWPVRSRQSGGLFDYSEIWKTGQTKCYDTAGVEVPCAGTGQDGEIQAGVAWPNPRFSVNGDCVTDNLTGLMWTKNASLTGSKTWQGALDYANSLTLCGYSDWRLSNRKELISLIDFSKYNPALPTGHPFTNVQTYYWSSTTYADNTANAWFVDMWKGFVYFYNKGGYNYNFYIWPVRGGIIDEDGDGYKLDIDCDDTNPAVNPGATEILNNSIDDDCNSATPVRTVSGNAYNYPVPFFRASLSLNVDASSLGTSYLRYYYTRNRLNLVSTSITGISASGSTATVTGIGTVNGVSGYTFTATISDGSPDAMGLEIKKPDGTSYFSTSSQAVSSGNFTVTGQ